MEYRAKSKEQRAKSKENGAWSMEHGAWSTIDNILYAALCPRLYALCPPMKDFLSNALQ